MKRKHYLVLLLMAFIGLNACSDDDDDNNIIVNNSKIKLIANKTQVEPFEDIKVSIDVDLELLQNAYDSIKWETDGTAYESILAILNPYSQTDDERDIRITNYKVGKFKTYAFGYKDGNVISADSIEYEVTKPTGDFISVKWNSNKVNQFLVFTTGQTPVKYNQNTNGISVFGGANLKLNNFVENTKKEYATLAIWSWAATGLRSIKSASTPNLTDFDWDKYAVSQDYSEEFSTIRARSEFEYQFLHGYLTDLYGSPNYVYEGKDPTQTTLTDEYSKRFAYSQTSEFSLYPYEIWETPTSYICLLISYTNFGEGPARGACQVIAEPR